MMMICLKDLLQHYPFCPQLLLKEKSFLFPRILITHNRCSCEKRGPPETVLLWPSGEPDVQGNPTGGGFSSLKTHFRPSIR